MQHQLTRRNFMATAALGAGAAMAMNFNKTSSFARAAEPVKTYKTQLHKAFIVDKVTPERMEALAKIGVEGVETTAWNVDVEEAREARRIAEAAGVKIHSVMRAWTNFNTDSAEADVQTVIHALKAASAYGASTILLVPCRIGASAPAPWDFKVEYDPATLMLSKVVEGDNSKFAEYIEQHNKATEASYRCLAPTIPVAAYEGVTIGLENVWNNLWCTPEFYAAFIKSFDNVWVKSYFDLGNHVMYAPTEDWLRALGKDAIVKLHIKDFLFDKEKKVGEFVPIGKGSIDWISVRNVIEEIEYDGFVTLESGGYSDEQHAKIFENFFNGVKITDGV
ncbi:MAG: sugar phosphate isomerase/epimerase [Thermoguttaceae bacterium]|nr:sugar phosphate isomerase/epimerase [Thermoguttaceae bacterium]